MIDFCKQIFTRKKYLQRFMGAIAFLILATQTIATPAEATGIYELPTLSAGDRTWVIDKSEVLSRISEGDLTKSLDNLANQTGNEVRFVTIRRLDYGETADSFADKLFEMWFPTKESQANQTLLLLDTLTNGVAIRTGEKVKSLLSDDIAKSVAEETVLVPLREGDKYNEAFLAASDRLGVVLSGKPDPGPPQIADNIQVESTFKKAEETDTGNATIIVVVLLILATVIPMVTYFWYQGFSN